MFSIKHNGFYYAKLVACCYSQVPWIDLSVRLPVMARVDNVGAKLTAGNITATSHTKCADLRYKYVNEYVEDKIVEIVFVKSAENDGSFLTENLSRELIITPRRW